MVAAVTTPTIIPAIAPPERESDRREGSPAFDPLDSLPYVIVGLLDARLTGSSNSAKP